MRMSRLFSQTLHEAPGDAEVTSHQLLLRAGFIQQLTAGVFSYLPLAQRSLSKIESIIRQEMNEIGGQEIGTPVVQPAEIWKETGRWYLMDSEMGRFKDRSGRDMAIGPAHEEVIADLARKEIRSYRQLPQTLYHIQTTWADEHKPRTGLIRAREFTMENSYSLDSDEKGLDRQYRAHYQAYFNIFRRCGLPVVGVRSDIGMINEQIAHELMYCTSIGEDSWLSCPVCGFSANQKVATFKKTLPDKEEALPVEKVATPNCKTIDSLASFLGVPTSRTAKAVFMIAAIPEGEAIQERFVFAVVRGDMEVNEIKLANAIKAKALRPATEEEIRTVGAIPGYASPVGLTKSLVIIDDAIPDSPNLVSGANEEGYHLRNVNFGRDYQAGMVIDIAIAQPGDPCPQCENIMQSMHGVEVGHLSRPGTRFSNAMGCNYLDAEGKSNPVVMGSYGIGLGRLLACIAEEHHDEYGLKWPISVAPYQLHLVVLAGKGSTEVLDAAESLYAKLQKAGIEALYDDRPESPGVKFNDADLIGIPIRLTVGERSLKAGGVEFKRRDLAERENIPLEQVNTRIKNEILALQAEVA